MVESWYFCMSARVGCGGGCNSLLSLSSEGGPWMSWGQVPLSENRKNNFMLQVIVLYLVLAYATTYIHSYQQYFRSP